MRLPILTFAALLAALPAAAADADPAKEAKETCLLSSRLDGFKNVTRETVVLTAGRREYLAELAGPCPGLEDSIAIGAESRVGCFGAGDTLIYDDGTGTKRRCMVSSVKPIAEEPAAAN